MKPAHWFFLWVPGAFCVFYLATIDLFPMGQFFVLLLSSFLMIFFYILERTKKGFSAPLAMPRLLFMVVVGFASIHYFSWRIQFSIPWDAGYDSLFASLALLLAELMGVTLAFMGMFINIHPLRREYIPVSFERNDLPVIDVLIPSYDEGVLLLRSTMLAASNMNYPTNKLHVYLLDDGATEEKCQQSGVAGERARHRKKELQALCAETGCHYLTRKENSEAKAGNINAALNKVSGDFIVVFDADHVPTVDFLEKTVGSVLDDDKVAILQTPHFMLNRDPIEKNLGFDEHMPGEGEMFYSLGLRGMDNWNSGFFCGSGALIRRSALDKIGGILTKTIVEDAETSLELITHGYKTKYLYRPLLVGLNTESIASFIIQRTRWATGMMQLLRYRNPLFLKGLTIGQRIGYFNAMFYWLFGLAHMIFLLSPAMAILFGTVLFDAPPVEIFLYVIPYLLSLHLSMHLYYGRLRWWFVSEIYETIQSFLMFLGPFSALIRPAGKFFSVTPKDESLEKETISSMSKTFYLLLFVLLMAGLTGIYHMLVDPKGVEYFLVSLMWNSYNILFILAALGAMVESAQRRSRPRVKIDVVTQITVRGKLISCRIEDMTEGGALLCFSNQEDASTIEKGELELPFSNQSESIQSYFSGVSEKVENIPFDVTRIHPRDPDNKHCLKLSIRFQCDHIHQHRSIVAFVYGDSDRWRDVLKGRNKPSTLTGGAFLLGRAVKSGLLHLKKVFTILQRREKLFPSKGRKS